MRILTALHHRRFTFGLVVASTPRHLRQVGSAFKCSLTTANATAISLAVPLSGLSDGSQRVVEHTNQRWLESGGLSGHLPVQPFKSTLIGHKAMPNPSLEPTRTGMALGPLPGVVHHPSSGPSTTPALAARLKR